MDTPACRPPSKSARRSLQALNFFMADMQAGVGPFLGVFLLARGWESARIGAVMTLGAITGVMLTTPAGAWVDASRHKRWLVVIPGICVVLGSGVLLLSQRFWPVALSQMATSIAGAVIAPAVTGITLGMFRQSGFNRQLGINQAYNHAGNAVGAGLSGLLGWRFGLPAVFWLAAAFAFVSVIAVFRIPAVAIDDRAARGLRDDRGQTATPGGWTVLLSCKPLLILALALALFHLGNAVMLPLYGMAVVSAKQGDPALLVGTTILVAQATMICTALIAMRMAQSHGYWIVLLISFISLPIRGLIAACLIKSWGVLPVQVLDGVGAGLQSVAVPGLAARILNGTGRINIGQGALMTAQGAGAALSPALGGWLAERYGYSTAFVALGALAAGSVMIWVLCARLIRITDARGAASSTAADSLTESP